MLSMSSRTPGRYLLHILAHPHIRLKAVNSELGIISYMYTVPEHSCAARSSSALCHAADSFCTRELYLRTTHCECAPCIDSLFLSTCPRGVLCSALPCAAIPMRHQCYALSVRLPQVHACSRILLSQHSTALSLVRFSLHLLRDFDVHFEELCNTSIQADGLALVQFAFAVVVWDAFLRACVDESVHPTC